MLDKMPKAFDNIEIFLVFEMSDTFDATHLSDFCEGYLNLGSWEEINDVSYMGELNLLGYTAETFNIIMIFLIHYTKNQNCFYNIRLCLC
jgi:hypothetical protein